MRRTTLVCRRWLPYPLNRAMVETSRESADRTALVVVVSWFVWWSKARDLQGGARDGR